MDEYGKIRHDKIVSTLQYLKDNRVLVKVKARGRAFESVTLLTDLRIERKASFFRIDPPEGMHEVLSGPEQVRLRFEFNGPDKLLYTFELRLDASTLTDMRLPLPQEIERIQRRRDFRLSAPMGTRLLLRQLEPPLTLCVVDFSLGGLLCFVESAAARQSKHAMLIKGRTLNNLELVFQGAGGDAQIAVARARIVRIDRHPVTNYRQYAFQFIAIEKSERKRLVDVLYGLQRIQLRQRVIDGT